MIGETISRILMSAGRDDSSIRPTELYNEGWMLKLILDWAAANASDSHELHFFEGARWFSEGLLVSQFRATYRGDELAEKETHSDGTIGHFRIGESVKAGLELHENARQLVTVEAKMFSGLSKGVKRAPEFDQASRTVACMAELFAKGHLELAQMERLGFYVIAPRSQIEKGVFEAQVDRHGIRLNVEARVASYAGRKDADKKEQWLKCHFCPTLEVLKIGVIAWEDLVAEAGPDYEHFYKKCLEHNGPKKRTK